MAFSSASLHMHAGPAPEALAQKPMMVQRPLNTVCSRVRRSHRASNSRRSLRVLAEASDDNTIVPAELSLVTFSSSSPAAQSHSRSCGCARQNDCSVRFHWLRVITVSLWTFSHFAAAHTANSVRMLICRTLHALQAFLSARRV